MEGLPPAALPQPTIVEAIVAIATNTTTIIPNLFNHHAPSFVRSEMSIIVGSGGLLHSWKINPADPQLWGL